jgi:hypothetical protein
MSEFKSPNFRNEDGSAAPDIVGVTTFTSPSGDGLAPGMLRFNTDIGRLEVWRGDHWATILGESPNIGISTNPAGTSGGLGTRALYGASATPTYVTSIDYYTVSTLGNGLSFGDLTSARGNGTGACSSSTRGIFMGGIPAQKVIDYVTFSSGGTASSFGNNILNSEGRRAVSNQTRGVSFGGYDRPNSFAFSNTMDYVTIASTGDAKDFGDLSADIDRFGFGAAFSSSTRGVLGGSGDVPNSINVIRYFTISTQGNTQDFGDSTQTRNQGTAGFSNSTRGIFAGGFNPGTVNVIDFITIASTGNSQDFGDLSPAVVSQYTQGGCSSTRGLIAGTVSSPLYASLEYITIATTGDSVDFGDSTTFRAADSQMPTNGHGGL